MPQVNLSTLSGPELRRLLDTTRERGEAALSYQILQEMAARREGGGRRSLLSGALFAKPLLPRRRPDEARVIALDLGDPMEPSDELPPLPAFRPLPPEDSLTLEPAPAPRRSRGRKTQAAPVPPAAKVEPPPSPEPTPRSVWDDDPPLPVDEAKDLHLRAPHREDARVPRRLSLAGAGFAAGIALGAAAGWSVAGMSREPAAAPAAPAAAPIRTAVLAVEHAPAPLPVVPIAPEPEPAAEAPPEPTGGPLPPDLAEGPLVSPDAEDVAQDTAVAEAVEPPASRKAEAVRTAAKPAVSRVAADACAAAPTPADRTICGDRELRRLQRELREAYAEALSAHEERTLLRQRQLAWREARNTVSDPGRLERLYEQRIRRLNAATAEARRER